MHHLVLGAGRDHAGLMRLGRFLEAQEHDHFGAGGLAVEIDRLLAAAVEEQIGLYLHGTLLGGRCLTRGPIPSRRYDERRGADSTCPQSSIAWETEVQKSAWTAGGLGESMRRCVSR